ncbi:high mobility group box domain-containing protein [Circinella umbellata]|nr:high mobility group box domain-containing protein [Circinella umbellata]
MSVSSERSHDALFVSANNTDWHSSPNSGSKNDDDDDDDGDDDNVQLEYEENNEVIEEIEEIHDSDESPSSSPLNGTTTTSNNSRNVVSVASHSGAAEAEALAGLTSSIQRNDVLRRLAYKRHGEKPKRVKRPPNAYLLFNRDVRHKILDGNPNLTVSEISKEISERWNTLSEESKAYYNQEAARLKQRHMDDNPNFIYTRRSKAELEEAGYRSRPSKKRKIDDIITTTAIAANDNDPHQQQLHKNRNSSSDKQNGGIKERDPRGRKKKRLKNPTAPKHPMSGFLFYSIKVRSEIVERMPKATVGEISKVIAERWRKLDEEDRSPYVQQAKMDKERYAREMESFTATMVEGLDEAIMNGSNGNHHHRQGNMSPVELDSHTIATVAQMVNPRGEHLLPPLSSSCSPRQYQVLPATPRNDE